MDKLLEAVARILEAVKPFIGAFIVAMGVRADERTKQRLREAEKVISDVPAARHAADSVDGMSDNEVTDELDRILRRVARKD